MKGIKTLTIRRCSAIIAMLAVMIFIAMPLAGCAHSDPPDLDTYTVTFDSNGGSAVSAQHVSPGSKAEKPEDPRKANNKFGGWYKNAKLTVAWNFDKDTVNADTVLYARWIPVTSSGEAVVYTVTFDSNGGSAVSAQTVSAGGKVTLPENPKKTGNTFGGWYADSGLTEPWNFGVDPVNSNITLYAKWTGSGEQQLPGDGKIAATFNVGYDARKAGASNPPAQYVKSGAKLTEPTVELDGCSIEGWYVENGSEKWDFASDTLTANTTLFAKWRGTFPTIKPAKPEPDPVPVPDDYTPTLTDSGKLYIHYLRSDGNYDGWHIWAWTGNGQWFEKTAEDKSGAVYEIDLASVGIYGTTGSVSFIVALNIWEAKDGGDNSLNLASAQKVGGSYHWYVQTGRVAKGTAFLAKPIVIQQPVNGNNVDRSFAKSLKVMDTATNTEEMGVGYQIFVASFCDGDGDGMGDLRGIINKLDYLSGLNVDVLWLTPVQSSNSYHGYDCYDYYSIDPKFGTNADYRELVYKSHQRGIKVIMDLVVNHTSTQNEWFIKSKNGVVETVTYQDGTTKTVDYTYFYRWSTSGQKRYHGADNGKAFYSSFGSSMPELNYDYQEARDAMADVAMYWMAYGLDGFRMDAIKHMFMWDEGDHNGDVEGRPSEAEKGYNFNLTKDVEWFKEFNYRLKSKYPDCFLLGEDLTGDVMYVAPFYAGMDSLFDFNTYYDLPGRIKSGDAARQASVFNDNAEMYRQCRQDRPINSMIGSNHDIPRLAYQMDNDVDMTKLYFAIEMTMPGLSWIYYGDEIGMEGGKDNDQKSRQPMKWTSDWQNRAMSDEMTNYHYDVDLMSVREQESDEGSLLNYVKALTKLRNDNPALINGDAVCSSRDGMLIITVTGGGRTYTVYHNFTGSSKTVTAQGEAIFGSTAVGAYGTAVFVKNS